MSRPAAAVTTRQKGPQWVRERTFTCTRCGAVESVKDVTRRPDPEAWALNELKKRGWREVWRANRIHCLNCGIQADNEKANVTQMKKPVTKTQTDTTFAPLASAAGQRALSDKLRAEEPRKPTREDNRRIQDALEGSYNEDAGHYCDGESDETVAAELKVPRAWVEKIREEFFGPNLTAAEKLASDQLAPMRATLTKLRDDHLDLATRAEQAMADLERIASNLSKKAA